MSKNLQLNLELKEKKLHLLRIIKNTSLFLKIESWISNYAVKQLKSLLKLIYDTVRLKNHKNLLEEQDKISDH